MATGASPDPRRLHETIQQVHAHHLRRQPRQEPCRPQGGARQAPRQGGGRRAHPAVLPQLGGPRLRAHALRHRRPRLRRLGRRQGHRRGPLPHVRLHDQPHQPPEPLLPGLPGQEGRLGVLGLLHPLQGLLGGRGRLPHRRAGRRHLQAQAARALRGGRVRRRHHREGLVHLR